MQETACYEEPAPAPETAAPAGEKVDTVEFAIAPHPEEPEEIAPTPIPEAPAIDESRFQDISGLYDEPEAKPARRRKASTTTKRTTRKKASAEPQEELNSPAFDNFEGVDFDS